MSLLLDINLAENDIAIIKVRSPDSLTCLERRVWPACLPIPGEEEEEEEYVTGLVSGWGRLGDHQSWSESLRAANIPIVSTAECKRNVKLQTYQDLLFTARFSVISRGSECPEPVLRVSRPGLCRGHPPAQRPL